MDDVLSATPQASKINTGVTNPKDIANALTEVLADTYRLVFKTHAYHWNVEGPMFFAIHNLTETQYEDLFAATDVLAERIRALGQIAPFSMREIIENSTISDLSKLPSAGEMCADLAAGHEDIARRMHALIETAENAKDPVTADLATSRSAFHEQAAWMLRSIGAG